MKKDQILDAVDLSQVVSLDNYVLAVQCNEPEGTVLRYVRPFYASLENIERFYNKAKKHRTLYGHEILSGSDFLSLFFYQDNYGVYQSKGLFWVIDDFEGMFYITDIDCPNDCLVHYTFFSGRHRGREVLVMEMLSYLFSTYGFHRLSAQIPAYANPMARRFATDLGFIYEGKRRRCLKYKEKWFDINLYGLLKEEFSWNIEKYLRPQEE